MSVVSVKLCYSTSKNITRILRQFSSGSQNTAFTNTKFKPNHPYVSLFPWKTKDEFVDLIEKSVIYNQGGLIAINKPFGVAINGPTDAIQDGKNVKTVVQTMSTHGIADAKYSMEEILPLLKTRLSLDFLSIVKSPERFTSGIMLLATSKNTADAISKAFRRSVAKKMAPFNYWALTTVIPQTNHSLQKVGIRLIDVKEFHEKVPIIEPKISSTAIKNELMTPVLVKMTVLTLNNLTNTALVEVEISKTTMHFLRVYMAYKLSPILGDGMYSGRVKTVLGKPVIVSPFNRAAYDTRPLSDNLSIKLQVPKNKFESIPTHLHLHQVTLNGYDNNKDLIINCSPPRYFTWSLDRLSLNLEPEAQVNTAISN